MGMASFLEDITLRYSEAGVGRSSTFTANQPETEREKIRVAINASPAAVPPAACPCAFCRPRATSRLPNSQHLDADSLKSTSSLDRKLKLSRIKKHSSPFVKELYAGLRAKCLKFCNYVLLMSKSGDWAELAHKLDWQCADIDAIMTRSHSNLDALVSTSKLIVDQALEMTQKVDCIVHDLDVFITAIDRSVEIILFNKERENVEELDKGELAVEREAAWILHRWLQTKEEVKKVKLKLGAIQANFDDYLFDHAMEEVLEKMVDKDATS